MKDEMVSFEKLLTVGETARLLGVCENTLRDWDKEGKFSASRTEGGHRRYFLEQVREYLEKNPSKEEERSYTPFVSEYEKIAERWKNTSYLSNCSETEKLQLGVLLENCRLYHETLNGTFKLDHMLWMTREIFLRMKFRKLVSVQPLLGPCGMAYYAQQKERGIRVRDEVVTAKTHKFETKLFNNGDFDTLKGLYADSLANELDMIILQLLPRINAENLVKARVKLSDFYDYIIISEPTALEIKNVLDYSDVEILSIPCMLDETSFIPLAYGGRYLKNSLTLPIFSPYILFIPAPVLTSSLRSILTRYGYFR